MAALPPAAPIAVFAPRGAAPVVVTVSFPALPDLKFNRAAPNRVALTFPWGRQVKTPLGVPDPGDPARYFARLDPLRFTAVAPVGTPAGRHLVRLDAELFVCAERRGQCYRKTLRLVARVAVGGGAGPTNVPVSAALLRPSPSARP